jgi:thiol-disulfide isomerase/thioredoxin
VLLIWPSLADLMTRPLVAFGNRLSQVAPGGRAGGTVFTSFVLGVATGFLWAPCAGPILGLILTGAAIQGANVGTSLLLLTYAAGAATSLALALLIGGRVFAALKRSLGAGEWIRRGLGVAILAAVVVIALGLDSGVLTQLSLARTASIEQSLFDTFRPAPAMRPGGSMMADTSMMQTGAANPAGDKGLPVEGKLPSLTGAVEWINTPALTPQALRGKVVLVDFWTYSCINCLRTLPYVRGWAQKYKDHGLVVLGVHTPEFAFEKKLDNVRRAVRDLGITYPVAVDNDYAIWSGFFNNYWPADYFIDANGSVRGHEFGEGHYEKSERLIQQLLAQAGYHDVPSGYVTAHGTGIEAAAASEADVQSPETYIGFERAQNFKSPQSIAKGQATTYSVPEVLQLNQWALGGSWMEDKEKAVLAKAPGRIAFRFHARDLHLVLGPTAEGAPVRFRVSIDGAAPGLDHGVDTDAKGEGIVTEQRLYQLIRQSGAVREHTFTIEFLTPGVQAFSFTFG